LLADGSCCHYLRWTGQSPISSGIEEFSLYFCNRLSFSEVAKLLERVAGQRLVCQQTLWNWAQEKAHEISAALREEVEAAGRRSLAHPTIDETVDIYEEKAEEVLVMTDAIQVKAQKKTREVVAHASEPGSSSSSSSSSGGGGREGKKVKRINMDLLLLEGQDGSFRHLCAGLGEEASSLLEVAEAHLRREWGDYPRGALPVVAVTDGARSIRLLLEGLFGPSVRVILDWYHLAKKVYQLLSMVAHTKDERERMQERVLGFLWRGGVREALSCLREVSARRVEALSELVAYLERHASEIIDYERRAKAGKVIGSGRMEKAVDQAVGMRQKKKGMSWSDTGSRALALLKVVELNGEWDELWAAAA
jgi:hypothetical protein